MFLTKGNCQGDNKQNWGNNHFQNQKIPVLVSNKTSTTAAMYSYLAVHIKKKKRSFEDLYFIC